jgi:hypothetical protein
MQISLRRAMLTAALMCSVSGVVIAAPPSSGLGQAWPNATDMSTSTSYHAYQFQAPGGAITYVQINDVAGNVIGAIGNAGGTYFVLPVGQFSQQVSVPQQPAATTPATPIGSATQVYNDGTTSVTAQPMSDGSTQLNAVAVCDPVTCNTKGA